MRKLAREGMSRNAIAKLVGISGSTVTSICNDARPPISFDRAPTAAAVEAKVIDAKARRAAISIDLLDLYDELRAKLFEPRTVRTTDGNGRVISYEQETTARDWKDTVTAMAISVDKHLVLTRHDTDDRDLPAVDAWLVHVLQRTPEGAS